MAQVTLQAIVNFDQVNRLDKWIKETDGKKITIDTTSYSKAVKEAEKATQELLKTQKAQAQANEAAAKAEKAIASATTEQIKAKKELVRIEIEQERKRKTELQTDQQAIKNRRETIKLEREEAKAQKEANKTGKEHNETVKKQGLLYDILGRSVSSFLARMAAYRAVYAGIRAVTNGFKEALDTLKAVDDELVTVRKVTGFDAGQMANVESQAYAVASKYGASAADYTSSVAAFARAGYKEVSSELAELAEKTKIVGDTTADVAQQFLLSVDAAYQYKGNIEKLNAVLDGANEIDNRFATSIEKIAEGMGIVAPVAAQMNVSVDELAAGIGTITAVTQRSGTEAARALRAIFLNIVGDTKTEIDEGVTWTTGEIAGLRDVIKLYAKDAYDAAQASGKVIDPMRAIAGLAQSVKDGILTEAKLTEMVSDIGGKLRTSQLLAIVNNWDMYESMLETYRNAYGSADKEIENAMDSWTRKTNVLKNTWTEFVKTGLNSNAIKGALDLLTGFIQRLDSLPAVMTRIAMIVVGLQLPKIVDDLQKAKDKVVDLFKAVDEGAKTAQSASSATAGFVGIAIAAVAAAWSAYSFALGDAEQKQKKAAEASYKIAKAASESSDNILTLYADFNTAKEGSNSLTESAQKLAEALGTDIPEGAEKAGAALAELTREKLLDAIKKLNTASLDAGDVLVGAVRQTFGYHQETGRYSTLFQSGFNAYEHSGGQLPGELREFAQQATSGLATRDGGSYEIFDTTTIENAVKFHDAMQAISDAVDEYVYKTGDASARDTKYYNQLIDYLTSTKDAYEKYAAVTKELDTEQLKLRFLDLSSAIRVDSVDAYEKLIDTINLKNRGSDEEREALIALAEQYYPQFAEALNDAAEAEREVTEAAKGETDALFANQKALDANATAEERLAAAKKDAEAAVAKLIPALITETGELTENAKAAFAASSYLADLAAAELSARNEAANANYAALRAELAGVSEQALKAATAIMAMEAAYISGETSGVDMHLYRRYSNVSGATRAAEIMRQMADLERQINAISVTATAVTPYTSSYKPSSGSGSSGGSGHSGGSSGSGSSSASTEDKKLTALKDRVSLLKSELALMKERGDSEEDQIAKMREIQEALRKEYEYLESIKGDQTTINNLYQEWYSYANQISDLEGKAADEAQKHADAIQAAVDAQKALDNILKNRSVRVYNASTGQWEWQADPAAVASAQSDLNNAISSAGYTQDAWALLYSALSGIASIKDNWLNSGPGAVSNAFGGNSYGNTYNFGNIRLSEAQAQSMTVAEFARLANALPAFNNSP